MSFKGPDIEWLSPLGIPRPRGDRFLVYNVLPHQGLAVVWGAPKTRKTFWVLNLAAHIALGKNWMGLATKQGPVFYNAFEGQSGMRYRMRALVNQLNNGEEFPLFTNLQRLRFNKSGKQMHRYLMESIDIKCQTMQTNPVLIILDTMSRSIEGGEIDDKDMLWYIQCCLDMSDKFKCLVMPVHHPNAEGVKPRGHTSLTGAADCQIKIWKPRNALKVCSIVEHIKDGPPGDTMTWDAKTVNIEHDDSGNMITSCILEPDSYVQELREEAEELRNGGDIITPHIRTMIRTMYPIVENGSWIKRSDLANKLEQIGMYDKKVNVESRKRIFRRRVKQMERLGLIEIIDDNTVKLTEKGLALAMEDLENTKGTVINLADVKPQQ